MSARSLPEATTLDERIAQMTDVIVRQFHPEQTILFGPQARRHADARSDVDLLVVMPDDVDACRGRPRAMRTGRPQCSRD